MKTGDFTVVLAGWGADYDDPETWFGLFETGSPFNYGKYSNPAYDEALARARTAGTDLTKRTNAYAEAEKVLVQDDMGIAPIYYRVNSYLQQPYVKNLIQRASGPISSSSGRTSTRRPRSEIESKALAIPRDRRRPLRWGEALGLRPAFSVGVQRYPLGSADAPTSTFFRRGAFPRRGRGRRGTEGRGFPRSEHPEVNGVRRWVAAFAIFALFLAGCGRAPASGSEGANAPAPKEQVLRLPLMDEPPELDAQKTTDAVSIDILNAVQEGLVRIGPDGKPRPGVAERWEVSPDGTVYTFYLRKDAKWSNGDPVTAQDFLAGWKRVLAPETASEYSFLLTDYIVGAQDYSNYQRYLMLKEQAEKSPADYRKAYGDRTPAEVVYGEKMDAVPEVTFDAVGVKAKDDRTLEITLLKPIPYIYELLAFPTYFPFHERFYAEHREKYASEASELLYNGPFVLSEWVHGSKVVLTKNPNYWDRDSVNLDRVTFDVLKDVNTAVRLYEGGQIDRVVLSGDLAPKYRQRDDYHVFVEYFTYFLMFNFEKPPFQNEKVRKALAYAVDRKAYAETVLQNGSPPAYGLVPEGEPAWAGADTTFRDWSKKMFGGPLFQDVGENPALKEEAK
ncbi:MAG: hypothetical protein KM296_08675, partial [Brockia lithotrophica]|nr:hypothetical protein [Brockia lithotrophica]